MNPFTPIPPQWTNQAIHARTFSCPQCKATSLEAQQVWINRTSPVTTEDFSRKWQEFYHCHCGCSWWGWSSDRQLYPMEETGDSVSPSQEYPG